MDARRVSNICRGYHSSTKNINSIDIIEREREQCGISLVLNTRDKYEIPDFFAQDTFVPRSIAPYRFGTNAKES